MSELEQVLKDYRDNERDIQMAQLAVDGHWSTVSYPKGILEECLSLRPAIVRRIVELGGTVPVSEMDALRAELETEKAAVSALQDTVLEQRAELQAAQAYADKLAGGLPDGMLPKDVENLRGANLKFAQQVNELEAELQAAREDAADKQRELEARGNILNRVVERKLRLFPDELGNGWIDSIDRLADEVERLRVDIQNIQAAVVEEGHSDNCAIVHGASFDCSCGRKEQLDAIDCAGQRDAKLALVYYEKLKRLQHTLDRSHLSVVLRGGIDVWGIEFVQGLERLLDTLEWFERVGKDVSDDYICIHMSTRMADGNAAHEALKGGGK